MLEDLLKEIKELQDAAKILSKIWSNIDVYSGQWQFTKDGRCPDDVMKDLRQYFKFDDGE